jgi:AraC-like DNA-binding protein
MERVGFTVQRWESESGYHDLVISQGRGGAATLAERYAGYREVGDGITRRTTASTGIALILAFGDPLIVAYGDESSRKPTALHAFVVGNHTKPAVTMAAGDQHGVEVNLTPAGATALFRVPLDELTDRVVPLESVLGRAWQEIVERLAAATSWSSRFELLDGVLARQLDRVRLDPEVDRLWRQLVRRHGSARIESLVDDTGRSRRQLTRRFRQQVGLTPKACARVVRFEHALDLLRSRTGANATSLADTAVSAGYYDQAHFNREFRQFAGCTPTEFLAAADHEPEVQFVQDGEPPGFVSSAT